MKPSFLFLAAIPCILACNSNSNDDTAGTDTVTMDTTATGSIALPAPDTNAAKAKFSKVIDWPYSYFGKNEDPRLKGQKTDLVAVALVPDVAVGAHTASLGLAFYKGTKFPEEYRNGAFIGQHGSWNRSALAGYKVAFVPFKNGKPSGPLEDFLTGFIANEEKGEVYGRPVDVAVAPDGALLVADDVSSTVWRVAAK